MLTKEDARGDILGYYILYKRKSKPEVSWKNRTVNGADITFLVLAFLDEYTPYQFAIQAFNSKGVSDRSEIEERKTDEDGELLKQSSSCSEDFCRQSAQNILSYVITNIQPTRTYLNFFMKSNSDSTKTWLFCAFFENINGFPVFWMFPWKRYLSTTDKSIKHNHYACQGFWATFNSELK